MRLLLGHALLLLTAAHSLGAQGAPGGRLEGTVTDSILVGPLAGATVSVTRRGVEPETTLVAIADGEGRFRVTGLEPGRYWISFSTPFLDSLAYAAPARETFVQPAALTTVELSGPSTTTLRSAACSGATLPRESGVLVGTVSDADTEQPLRDAQVAVAWTELTFDRPVRRVVVKQHSAGVKTDSLGQYRVCGVPTDSWLLVQVESARLLGSALQVLIDEAVGVRAQPLSFSAAAARPSSALLAALRDSVALPPLMGTASISGTVRGGRGEPVPGVEIRVVDASPVVRTDARGEFTLAGLPAGSQEIEVRRIGHLVERQPVELRRDRTLRRDILLEHIASLDPVKVVARRNRYQVFETNRKNSFSGRFMNESDIARRNPMNVSDLLVSIPGFRVVGSGAGARLLSTRARCAPNVVIGSRQRQEINMIPPSLVGAIEIYPSSNGAPTEYRSTCGLIVIWVK